jgi:hypothetical protein
VLGAKLMKQQADIAILQVGAECRMTCVGCAEILEQAGLLLVERAFTFDVENMRIKVYSIATGHTLEECEELVKPYHLSGDCNPLNL